MDTFISEHISTLAVGLFLSVTCFLAFKAGKHFERSTISEGMHELALEKLKLKTEFKLEILLKQYEDANGILQLPERLNFKDIVEQTFLFDENIKEQILGLNKIYLDLVNYGTDSSYFVSILDTYVHLFGGGG